MDAWETLINGSTIASGDAWEHLYAQGGSGTGTYTILADGLGVEMGANDIDIEITADVEAAVDPAEIAVTIDQSPREVEL